MKSFENSTSQPEQEMAGIDHDYVIGDEKRRLNGFAGKAKIIARLLIFASALSFGGGLASEAYAQDTASNPKIEHVEKKKAFKEFSLKELVHKTKEVGNHDLKIAFEDASVEEFMKEQHVRFDEKSGSFYYVAEQNPTGEGRIVFEEDDNGAWADQVDVSTTEVTPRGDGPSVKTIVVKCHNSDGSVDTIKFAAGHIADFSTEKPAEKK